MSIAITGATGALGRLVLQDLAARRPNETVLALARSPEKLTEAGIEARRFDYSDPATLAPALAGVSTLLLISSSEVGQREAQHRAVIAAAKAAGVGHIVYTSLLHADRSALSLAAEHLATEAALRDSGIPTRSCAMAGTPKTTWPPCPRRWRMAPSSAAQARGAFPRRRGGIMPRRRPWC